MEKWFEAGEMIPSIKAFYALEIGLRAPKLTI